MRQTLWVLGLLLLNFLIGSKSHSLGGDEVLKNLNKKLSMEIALSDRTGKNLDSLQHNSVYPNVFRVRVINAKTKAPCPDLVVRIKFPDCVLSVPGSDPGMAYALTDSDGWCSFTLKTKELSKAKPCPAKIDIDVFKRKKFKKILKSNEEFDSLISDKKVINIIKDIANKSSVKAVLVDWEFLLPGHKYENVLKVEVKNKNGKPAVEKDVIVDNVVLGADIFKKATKESKKFQAKEVTNENGVAYFDLDTSNISLFKGEFTYVLEISSTLGSTVRTVKLPVVIKIPKPKKEAATVKVIPYLNPYKYHPNKYYPNALKVQVTNNANKALAGITVRVNSTLPFMNIGGNDALAYGPEPDSITADQITNKEGVAYFSLKPLHSAEGGATDVVLNIAIVGSKKFKGTNNITVKVVPDRSWSDRIASEIFIGKVFQPNYNAKGEIEGFDDSSEATRFRIDSLWGKGRRWAIHLGSEFTVFDYLTGMEVPNTSGTTDGTKSHGSHGKFQRSSTKSNTQTKLDLKFVPSYSQMFYLNYQPGWATKYTKSSNTKDGRYDAWRFGLELKGGVISRDNIFTNNPNFDTQILAGEFGINLRQYQSRFSTPEKDFKNRLPIKFLDFSLGYFEEIAGQDEKFRIILDGGIRLFHLAGESIPFYVGSRINAGKGPDDIRLYFGTTFDISKIRDIFQGGDGDD